MQLIKQNNFLMKKRILSIGSLLMSIVLLASVSCSKADDKAQDKNATPKSAPIPPLPEGAVPNYRFVNFDSVSLQYNLATDFQEQLMRLQNNLDAEMKRQANNITAKENALQQKMNAYQQTMPTESEQEAFAKEYQNYETMKITADQTITRLQLELQQTQMTNYNTLMDSVQTFLKEFAPQNGYTAIFFTREVAPYYHPSLDVTREVIDGLNARYNKVSK